MEISALTRTVVTSTHALISGDGFVNSVVPGWTGCTVNVVISREMGARFTQTLVTLQQGGLLTGTTKGDQLFFYVVAGTCRASVGDAARDLPAGHFLYVPPGKDYVLENREEGTRLLTFRKTYERLEDQALPPIIFGDAATVKGAPFLGDEALRLQVLLPDNLSFDMAVNIFTYDPGGHLPFVETHIMEHGLTYLQGQGVYMLDQQWYPVKKGDSIWMAPYCAQWFTAMGKEPAVYIYYKNVNRL
ncbi:(S)-ureidoglycine aminohydrolase [Paraflavisolibacter sp. H34]|uniref:(S)-ureidoglycine aminohydrolase n=1 Tax=Huijunlia imazamoxiresistens TaxID=3127457 RepID=UPI00301B08BE